MAGLNRAVRVVTVALDGHNHKSDEEKLDFVFERMDFAAADGNPDIVCTPEKLIAGWHAPDSPVMERFSTWARGHGSYVVAAIGTEVRERHYNSCVVIDRKGEVVGQYNKKYPTEGELKNGTAPGDADPPVFDLDFGKVGFQICFDINWHDTWARLKEKGAELVFWSSAYEAQRRLKAFAFMNQYHVASSTGSGFSYIYDIAGDELSRSGSRTMWTDAVIYLGKRLFEIDYHISTCRKIKKKYGKRVSIVWQHPEDWFTMTSLDPELATEDIIKEFEMVPLTDYIARAEKAVNSARPE